MASSERPQGRPACPPQTLTGPLGPPASPLRGLCRRRWLAAPGGPRAGTAGRWASVARGRRLPRRPGPPQVLGRWCWPRPGGVSRTVALAHALSPGFTSPHQHTQLQNGLQAAPHPRPVQVFAPRTCPGEPSAWPGCHLSRVSVTRSDRASGSPARPLHAHTRTHTQRSRLGLWALVKHRDGSCSPFVPGTSVLRAAWASDPGGEKRRDKRGRV